MLFHRMTASLNLDSVISNCNQVYFKLWEVFQYVVVMTNHLLPTLKKTNRTIFEIPHLLFS